MPAVTRSVPPTSMRWRTRDELPDVVLAIRGGYGATRLLTQLHYDALRERLGGSSAVLVGHSDFTALQLALHAKSGLCTFSGPMLGADFGAEALSEFTWRHFWDTVRAPSAQVEWATTSELELEVEGPLWGGNLAVLCSLIGTPYFPAIEGGILFVEDVGEPPFRIERLLYQLHLSGVLGRQRALLLGDFSQCRPSGYDNGYGLVDSFAQIPPRQRDAGDRRPADGPRAGQVHPAVRRAGTVACRRRQGAAGFQRLSAFAAGR